MARMVAREKDEIILAALYMRDHLRLPVKKIGRLLGLSVNSLHNDFSRIRKESEEGPGDHSMSGDPLWCIHDEGLRRIIEEETRK